MINVLQSMGSITILIIALALFSVVLVVVLRQRISKVIPFKTYTAVLKQQHEQIKEKGLDDKQSTIKNFLDEAEQKYTLILDIVKEWLDTQRSLSNFQKYDFELHIDYYTRSLRIDHAEIARNLLLTGLLFTFIGLGLAFSTMESGTIATEDLTERLTQNIIPSISLAFSTTIAALITSLVVLLIGRVHNRKIDDFEEAISKFLIVDVHPYFEQGGKENDIRQVVGLMEGVSRNINEVNINLQNVGQQASNTLQELARGVGQFSELSAGHRGILERTENLLQKVYENNLESEKSIANLNSVIQGVTEIFNAEDLVLKDLVESSRNQQAHIEGLSDNTAKLIEASKQRADELKAAQKESEEALKLSQKQSLEKIQETIQKQVGEQVTHISDELSRLTQSVEQNNEDINQRYIKLNQDLKASSKDSIAQIQKVTEKIMHFAEQVDLTQRKEQEQRTAIIQKFKEMLADMSAETTGVWRDMSALAQTQAGNVDKINSMLNQRFKELYEQQKKFAEKTQQNHETHSAMVNKLISNISDEASSVLKGIAETANKQATGIENVNKASQSQIEEFKRIVGQQQKEFTDGARKITEAQQEILRGLKKQVNEIKGQQKTSFWNIFKRKG